MFSLAAVLFHPSARKGRFQKFTHKKGRSPYNE